MMHFDDQERTLFSFLIEEMAEVTKAISKADRFGWDSCKPGTTVNNKQSLQSEVADVIAVLAILQEKYTDLIPPDLIQNLVPNKIRKLKKYHPEVLDGINLSNIME